MFFDKNKKTEEILRVEIDMAWKVFLVINGIFLISMSKITEIKSIETIGELLVILLWIIYFIWIVWVLSVIFWSYTKLIDSLKNK